jgi:hypothetical protein
MVPPCYRRHRLPPEIIQHAMWLYLRFTLSYRDVEDLLADRGLDLSFETVRRWVLKFGPVIARRLRRQRHSSGIRDAGRRVTEYVSIFLTLVRGFCRPIHYAWPPMPENGDKNASTIRSKSWRITGFAI